MVFFIALFTLFVACFQKTLDLVPRLCQLSFGQFRKESIFFNKLLVSTFFDKFTFVENENMVGMNDRAEPVGDHDAGCFRSGEFLRLAAHAFPLNPNRPGYPLR